MRYTDCRQKKLIAKTMRTVRRSMVAFQFDANERQDVLSGIAWSCLAEYSHEKSRLDGSGLRIAYARGPLPSALMQKPASNQSFDAPH